MNVRRCLGHWLGLGLTLALGVAEAQELDLTLPDPPSVETLKTAAELTDAQATSVREVLAFHRGSAQDAYRDFQQARHGELAALIGGEAMQVYEDFRLKGQAFIPANAAYRRNSQQRRVAVGRSGRRGRFGESAHRRVGAGVAAA